MTTQPTRRAQGVGGIIAAAVAMQAAVWAIIWDAFGVARLGYGFFDLTDIGYYYDVSSKIGQGLAPFRDFFLEYPPLLVPLIATPGPNLGVQAYLNRFAVLMMLFMAAACAVTALAGGVGVSTRRSYTIAAVFSLYSLLLGPIAVNRYDAAVVLLLAVAILLAVRHRWVASAAVIGVGFALKITPAILLPLLLILAPRERVARMLVGFAALAAAPFVWVWLMGGQSAANLTKMFAYHLDRPLEVESLLATPFWVGRLIGATTITVENTAGSQVIASPTADLLAQASGVVLLLGLGTVFALVWRRRAEVRASRSLLFLAVLSTLLASLVGSKVLSPQYLVWTLPAVALVAVDRRMLGVLLGGVLLLTHIEFPANYWGFARYQLPVPIAIVVVRNLFLVAAFAVSLVYLWRIPPRSPKAESRSADGAGGEG